MKLSLSVMGILSIVFGGWAQVKTPPWPAAGAAGPVERGEYIVNGVAQCVQCHTPRSAGGELDRLRLLQGAPIPVASPWPNQRWAARAPHIAGLPGFRDEDVASLLTRGSRLDGRVPQAPMPQFHMSGQDAEAVIAYLRSLR